MEIHVRHMVDTAGLSDGLCVCVCVCFLLTRCVVCSSHWRRRVSVCGEFIKGVCVCVRSGVEQWK